jgi:beta-lactamase regulating signal transducer with metallopeptidase domain
MTLTLFATYIVQTTFAVTLLIGAVLLVRRPFATAFGAKAAYALWAIPFLRLIMPPMPANWTLFGLLTRPDTATPETVIRLTDPLLWQPTGFASGAAHQTLTLSNTFSPISAAPQNAFNLPVSLEAMLPFILSLWALGMLAAFARTLIRQRQAAALILAESHNISPALVTLAKETQMQLGLTKCNIAIKTSLLSSGPLVTGLIRPTVLLPEWFEDDYTITEQRFALMHEMMHVKRGDIFALYAANLALALQWFNPLAWLALRAFRADQEAACRARLPNPFMQQACPLITLYRKD